MLYLIQKWDVNPMTIVIDSSEDNLSSCDFTCIKCKSMWHEACLIKFTKRFNMHLYDKNKQLCVNCWKKREWFVREDFQDWKSINLSFLWEIIKSSKKLLHNFYIWITMSSQRPPSKVFISFQVEFSNSISGSRETSWNIFFISFKNSTFIVIRSIFLSLPSFKNLKWDR